MTDRSNHLQQAAGWLIVTVGLLHILLTSVRLDAVPRRAAWLLVSGALLVLVGLANIVFARPTLGDSMRRVWWTLAMVASVAGLAIAIAFTWMTRGVAPQALPLVMLFVIAAIITLSGSPATIARRRMDGR